MTFGQTMGGRVTHALGYTGLGVGASRWAAGVVRDFILRPDSGLLRLDFVRSSPVPFPPEPIRPSPSTSSGASSTGRPQRGRRGLLLRTPTPWASASTRRSSGQAGGHRSGPRSEARLAAASQATIWREATHRDPDQEQLAAFALVEPVRLAVRPGRRAEGAAEQVWAVADLDEQRVGLDGHEERPGAERVGHVDDPARLPGAEVAARRSGVAVR